MIPVPGVYLIRNCRTGATYVGASGNIERRWQSHRAALEAGHHSNRGLQQSWLTDGPTAFSMSLVEPVADDVWLLRRAEHRWLERLRQIGTPLYSEADIPNKASVRIKHILPKLRRLRQLAVLTQEELADRAGVRRLTITRLEGGGETRLSTVRKLASALKCEPRDLMGELPETY